ncbi:hypothetical protein ACFE04_008951 [Oxalis oulophora]
MAAIPICYKLPFKDQTPLNSNDIFRRWNNGPPSYMLRQPKWIRAIYNVSQRESSCIMMCASEDNEKQLRSIDSYYKKLQRDTNKTNTGSLQNKAELYKNYNTNTKKGLEALDAYLDKIHKDVKIRTPERNSSVTKILVTEDNSRVNEIRQESFRKSRIENVELGTAESNLIQDGEVCDLYLISILASINIAVFLFELASPVRNTSYELFSLPLLYGAKINDLILVGEWWRLVTPMFLHSGVFHVALGCWSLFTFGPQVCQGYGAFTFLLSYILGGVAGNITSFLHTTEPTVGGTGPVFAIIGVWLIYQFQNKDVMTKDVYDNLFQKAIITTGLSFILSHFGPIDDWTHLGAILTGIAYGFLTCSTVELGDALRRGQEGITLIRQNASPFRSLIIFTLFVFVLSSLLYFVGPPLFDPAELWKAGPVGQTNLIAPFSRHQDPGRLNVYQTIASFNQMLHPDLVNLKSHEFIGFGCLEAQYHVLEFQVQFL